MPPADDEARFDAAIICRLIRLFLFADTPHFAFMPDVAFISPAYFIFRRFYFIYVILF